MTIYKKILPYSKIWRATMAREFKASTFFNKYIPNYCLNGVINGSKESYYSYMFTDNTVAPEIVDLLESRMLVVLYSIISVHENKLIIPRGKTVDLSEFSKNAFRAIKSAPKKYYHTTVFTDNEFSDYIHLIFDRDEDNLEYTTESLKAADFYQFYNFDVAVAGKAVEITNCISGENFKDEIDFFMTFDSVGSKKFLELLALTQKKEPVRKKFYESVLNVFKNDNKISTKKEPVNFDDLETSLNYSRDLLNDQPRLEIFKLINESKNKRTISSRLFTDLYLEMDKNIKLRHKNLLENNKVMTPINEAEDTKNKEKIAFIDAFKEHYSLYAENNLRADTAKKIESHYDLVDAINLFSAYPYSPRQYENQAYIPLMIKAPIKKIKAKMITDLENMVHDFPHFSDIINYLVLSLKVRDLTDGIVNFKHLLIVGEHGVGKNAFVRRLNEVLGYVGNSINMTSVMAPFELAGMDAGWNSSAPGFFFNSILKNNAANPIVILDDLDKVTINPNQGNVNTAIIELIEPSNAKKYYERFFQIDINMSYVSVIGLANNVDDIDRGVLDLLKVFKVEKPSVAAISSIVFSIYKELKLDELYGFTHLTDNELNEIVIKFIISKTHSPRSMRKVIEESLNNKLIETVHKKEQSNSKIDDKTDVTSTQLINKEK